MRYAHISRCNEDSQKDREPETVCPVPSAPGTLSIFTHARRLLLLLVESMRETARAGWGGV